MAQLSRLVQLTVTPKTHPEVQKRVESRRRIVIDVKK
jgi:hypothetical protein